MSKPHTVTGLARAFAGIGLGVVGSTADAVESAGTAATSVANAGAAVGKTVLWFAEAGQPQQTRLVREPGLAQAAAATSRAAIDTGRAAGAAAGVPRAAWQQIKRVSLETRATPSPDEQTRENAV